MTYVAVALKLDKNLFADSRFKLPCRHRRQYTQGGAHRKKTSILTSRPPKSHPGYFSLENVPGTADIPGICEGDILRPDQGM